MVADGRRLEFLALVEDREVGCEFFVAVDFEQEVEGLQIVAFKIGVLCVGFV